MASSCIPYAEDEPKELGIKAGCKGPDGKNTEYGALELWCCKLLLSKFPVTDVIGSTLNFIERCRKSKVKEIEYFNRHSITLQSV
jgi:hypothetical protein